MAIRKCKMACMAHIPFLLGSAELDYPQVPFGTHAPRSLWFFTWALSCRPYVSSCVSPRECMVCFPHC